jgi:signal transduction histidine kinase
LHSRHTWDRFRLAETRGAVAPRREWANAITWKLALELAWVLAAYFVAGKLGQATTNIRSSNLGPVWPASGVALAGLLAYGYRVWPAVAAGAFLVAVESAVSPLAAAGQAAGAALAAVSGTFLLRKLPHFDPALSRLRDALGLIVFGAFCSALVSSSIGIASLFMTGVQPYAGLAPAWLIYWFGDGTGVLLITPLVFTVPQLLSLPRARIGELACLATLLSIACFVVFGELPGIPIRLDVLAFGMLPFVMWGAIRFGIAGASLSVFLTATLATILTALGYGPFAKNTPFIDAVLLDVLFGVLAVSGMSLAAVIVERERAEGERETLVRKQMLIEVQEQERARIARELHDDVGQRLAILAIRLTGVSEELRVHVSEIAADVQALSHELHPSRIELLGISGAVRQLCTDFAAQQAMSIDCRTSVVARDLPANVSLNLYRVLQEALHNAAKHSGVHECGVRLWAADGSIHLQVTDAGDGFDVESARAGGGIGLLSMEERIRLVDGTLSIHSRAGEGTTIHASVPYRE